MAAVQRRVGLLFGLFVVLLLIAGARALYLGGPHSGVLRRAAQTQQLTDEVVPAQRGTITDRNGVALAISEPAQQLSADPYLIKQPLAAAAQLAPLLGLTQAQVLTLLSEHTGFVYLARALAAMTRPSGSSLEIPGVAGRSGHAPRLPALDACRAGARDRRHRTRRGRAHGARVLGELSARGTRRRA